ncbi:SDR family NAD(P)-dependent oxidoreductase [Oricola indica]|uniref:SDR family NAD(P)-dependent oxidoreductase n=1 Tax=Oricola indica TaxID=2872591 RepID=UPI003CCB90B5
MTDYVLITGGTGGIGAACARLLATHGYSVILSGRDAGTGERLAEELQNATFVESDLSRSEAARYLANRACEISDGRLAGLINNAGVGARSRFGETTESLCDDVLSLNLRAPIMLTTYCLPALRAANGSIVMISSIAGKTGEEGLALYTASKAGLLGLTKALALEIAPEVRVNAICPGQIETTMMARTLSIPGRRQLLESRIPAGRLGSPEDIAEAAYWLISPRSQFVNGDVITVDGGETAGLRNPREH